MKPGNETELAEMVRKAAGPLLIRGGGTRTIGNPVRGELLDASGLTGITLYEPGALTMVARAGTPMTKIEQALAGEGQRLAFEPPDLKGVLGTQGHSTIGGVIAANASGPRRVQAGAARDFLLGVRFVDGTGRVIKNGGRVMKNVTGYDLVKLMAGSHGTLGVLTEVALKVLPEVEASATVCLEKLSTEDAVSAMSVALGSPYEVTAAAHVPGRGTYLRLEGFTGSVAYRAGRLRDTLLSFGEAEIKGHSADLWQDIRDVGAFQGKSGDIWRYSVQPAAAPKLVRWLEQTFDAEVMLDWGGGLVWALLPAGTTGRPADLNGHATIIRASDETRRQQGAFQPEPEPLQRLSAGLRARFDPRGILNPGRMG